MYFLSPYSVLSVFIASVLGFVVAPHLALVSRTAARAIRFGAWALVLPLAFGFAGPMILNNLAYRFDLSFDVLGMVGPLFTTVLWGCLAWAVLGLLQDAKPKGVL